MGLSSKKPLWVSISDTVPGNSTKNLDLNLLSELIGVKYILAARGNGLTKVFEVLVSNDSNGLADSVFGMVGDSINFQTNVSISGSDQILEIVNNETFTLTFEIKKLKI